MVGVGVRVQVRGAVRAGTGVSGLAKRRSRGVVNSDAVQKAALQHNEADLVFLPKAAWH